MVKVRPNSQENALFLNFFFLQNSAAFAWQCFTKDVCQNINVNNVVSMLKHKLVLLAVFMNEFTQCTCREQRTVNTNNDKYKDIDDSTIKPPNPGKCGLGVVSH